MGTRSAPPVIFDRSMRTWTCPFLRSRTSGTCRPIASNWRSTAATRTPSRAVASERVRSRPESNAAMSFAVRWMELRRPRSERSMILGGSSDPQRISTAGGAPDRLAGVPRRHQNRRVQNGKEDFRANPALGASHDPRPHLGARDGVHALRAGHSRRAVAVGAAPGRSQLRVHRAADAPTLERVDGPAWAPSRGLSPIALAPQATASPAPRFNRVNQVDTVPVQPVEPARPYSRAGAERMEKRRGHPGTCVVKCGDALTPPARAASPGRTGSPPRAPSFPSRAPAP